MMKLKVLDLFCGTKSIGGAFSREGHEVVTLDIITDFDPDICTNILDWDYRIFSPGHFDVIWASPPCEAFSVTNIGKNWVKGSSGRLYPTTEAAELGGALVDRTLEIIAALKPRFWFLENPRAALRKRMKKTLPRQTITYCQYGDTRMKPTDIWGTFPRSFPIRCCKKGDLCHEPAPRGARTGTQGIKGSIDRARIPRAFCELLVEHVEDAI